MCRKVDLGRDYYPPPPPPHTHTHTHTGVCLPPIVTVPTVLVGRQVWSMERERRDQMLSSSEEQDYSVSSPHHSGHAVQYNSLAGLYNMLIGVSIKSPLLCLLLQLPCSMLVPLMCSRLPVNLQRSSVKHQEHQLLK